MLGALQLVLGEGQFWGYRNGTFTQLHAPNATIVSAAAVSGSDRTTYLYVGYDGEIFRARGADAVPTTVFENSPAASVCAAGGNFYVLGKDGRKVLRTSGEDGDLADVSASFSALSGNSGKIKFLACGPLGSQKSGIFAVSESGSLEIFGFQADGTLARQETLSGALPNGVSAENVARAELFQLPLLYLANGSLIVRIGQSS